MRTALLPRLRVEDVTSYSASICYRECCYQKKGCLHSPDPVFRPSCGRDRQGGRKCDAHPWAKPPSLPEEAPSHEFEWEGTPERVSTELEFKGTYENDVTILCAVCMSNTHVRLGLAPIELSDWARDRFQELTAAGWLPPPSDVKNTLIHLGYMQKETS